MIKVLFFASLREAANTSVAEFDSEGVYCVRDLVAKFEQGLPKELSQALSDESAMVSINQQYAGWEAPLQDGAEVGFLPPVSGG